MNSFPSLGGAGSQQYQLLLAPRTKPRSARPSRECGGLSPLLSGNHLLAIKVDDAGLVGLGGRG
jgi:hypothetical protein